MRKVRGIDENPQVHQQWASELPAKESMMAMLADTPGHRLLAQRRTECDGDPRSRQARLLPRRRTAPKRRTLLTTQAALHEGWGLPS